MTIRPTQTQEPVPAEAVRSADRPHVEPIRSVPQIATGTFAALHNPDYRIFFGGSMVSNIGMWMQIVAQGWLVVTLTSSEFLVGLVSFCAMAPSLMFSLFGGVLADRVDKRRVLITAQLVSATLTTILATLIYTDRVELWHIMVISFGTGTVMAFSAPSWQAIVPEIVGRPLLLNAIALNSAQFNLTRVVGPSVGGILIRYIGVAGAYYLNALSYSGLLIAMIVIRPKHAPVRRSSSPEGVFRSLGSAFRYSWNDRFIRVVLALAAVQTVFIFPYTTLLPIFAKYNLGLGASGYSFLLTAAGIGAFAGAMTLAFRGETFDRARILLYSQIVFALGVAGFALSSALPLSLVALFFIGWALVMFLATGNTLVQSTVPDELRGRVMSIWMIAGFGLMPLGSLQAGTIASLTSPTVALVGGAVVTLSATAVLVMKNWDLFSHELQEEIPVA